MKKEIIIIIIIIIFIVIGDLLLGRYTENSLNLIGEKLSFVKECLNNQDECISQMNNINTEWNKKFNILTCFLEHSELEKIKMQLVAIEASIKINDYEYAYEEIDKAIYILEHLKDKQSLKLDNLL